VGERGHEPDQEEQAERPGARDSKSTESNQADDTLLGGRARNEIGRG